MATWRAGPGLYSWRHAPCPLEWDFYACAFGDAPLVGESLAWGSLGSLPVVVVIFVVEGCVSAGGGGIVFVVQSEAFSSSHLSPAAWLVRRPVSGTCDYPRGCGFCWFVWYPRSLPETFRSPRSCHAQGLGNSPAVRIWLA